MEVLLMRAGALGDVLLLRRAVAALARAGHCVRLVAPASAGRALVGPGPSEVTRLTAWDGPGVVDLLAGAAPSPSLEGQLRSDVALAFTDSVEVVEVLRPFAGRILSRSPHPTPGQHASLWFAAPVRTLGANPDVDPDPLEFTAKEREATKERLASLPPGFLAVHPGSGSPAKNWPAERFESLVHALVPDRPFLLLVGPADESATAPLREMKNAVVARGLEVRVLGALLSQAGLYVGNDSGVTHLAAASGAPTVALFGPTDPAVWAPVGPSVEVVRSATGEMDDVSVADVVAAARRVRGSD